MGLSIGTNAGSLLKTIQGAIELPDDIRNKEKSDDEKRARDLANAISQASA